jgi:hypothetical protein
MRCASLILFASAVLLVGPNVVSVAADEMVTHYGTVVAIDVSGGQLVFEEIGAWPGRGGVTESIRHTVELIPATRFTFASRTETPCDLVGGKVERSLDPIFFEVGDAVTIECRHEGARLIAVKVTVTAMR